VGGRERVLVLITDGQVGNEDQILHNLGPRLRGIRVFCLGIDQAVNAAFLRRLADLGSGTCELVESEDRLDEVMEQIHRRIGQPVLTGLRLEPAGLRFDAASLVPDRLPDVFAGAPVQILGRYSGSPEGGVALQATEANGQPWQAVVSAVVSDNPALAPLWARGQVRKLEDRHVIERREDLEKRIIETSLRFGVLSRFTAFVAVDRRAVVNQGGECQQIVQPVEMPAGWEQELSPAMQLALSVPVTDLEFSCRVRSAKAPTIRSLGDLAAVPFDDDTLRQIKEKLQSKGLRLGEEIECDFDEQANKPSGMELRGSGSRKKKRKSGAPKPPGVKVFKQRVREMLEILKQNQALDTTIKRRVLAAMASQLKNLLKDLATSGLLIPGMDRLEKVLQELHGDLMEDASVLRVWKELEEAFSTFGKKGSGQGNVAK
jgi:hypothetical protein